METIILQEDIKIFYVIAESFPTGIPAAMHKLHRLIGNSPERRIFGVSRPENGGDILYRAAAEELVPGEADNLKCDSMHIKKGKYVTKNVSGLPQNIPAISNTFEELLKIPNLDPEGFCVEWYANNMNEVKCMIRLADK
jgi:hypothetical protein